MMFDVCSFSGILYRYDLEKCQRLKLRRIRIKIVGSLIPMKKISSLSHSIKFRLMRHLFGFTFYPTYTHNTHVLDPTLRRATQSRA